MKALEELRKMDVKKLIAELAETEKKLAQIRFNVETGHSKEIHQIKKLKKQKAQIKTVLGEKQVEAVAEAVEAEQAAA